MSGRIYDLGSDPRCKKCGTSMWTSTECNFYGPKCKNPECNGGLLDAVYSPYEVSIEFVNSEGCLYFIDRPPIPSAMVATSIGPIDLVGLDRFRK